MASQCELYLEQYGYFHSVYLSTIARQIKNGKFKLIQELQKAVIYIVNLMEMCAVLIKK